MATRLKIPHFATEAEEADWWYDNRELVSDEFVRAAEEGELRRGTLARRAGLSPMIVRLESADLAKAKSIAAKRGLEYSEYLSLLVHEALAKEVATA